MCHDAALSSKVNDSLHNGLPVCRAICNKISVDLFYPIMIFISEFEAFWVDNHGVDPADCAPDFT